MSRLPCFWAGRNLKQAYIHFSKPKAAKLREARSTAACLATATYADEPPVCPTPSDFLQMEPRGQCLLVMLLGISCCCCLVALASDSGTWLSPDSAPESDDRHLLSRQRRAPCGTLDCVNGGTCNISNTSSVCSCPKPYSGSNCSAMDNYCNITQPERGITSLPVCLNGANCTALAAHPYFACSCVGNYTGARCDAYPCFTSPPCINGICTNTSSGAKCSCFTGWVGSRCETDFYDCPVGACLNGGRCVDGNASYTCDCSGTDYWGPTCANLINDCETNPCQNGGTCLDGTRNFTCKCHSGYSGRTCSFDQPDCDPNPCPANVTCLEKSKPTLYSTDALPPFNGQFRHSLAAGYVCDYGYSSVLQQKWASGLGTGLAIGISCTALLAVAIFLVVLTAHRQGKLSLGYFSNRSSEHEFVCPQCKELGENRLSSVSVRYAGTPVREGVATCSYVDMQAGNTRPAGTQIPAFAPISEAAPAVRESTDGAVYENHETEESSVAVEDDETESVYLAPDVNQQPEDIQQQGAQATGATTAPVQTPEDAKNSKAGKAKKQKKKLKKPSSSQKLSAGNEQPQLAEGGEAGQQKKKKKKQKDGEPSWKVSKLRQLFQTTPAAAGSSASLARAGAGTSHEDVAVEVQQHRPTNSTYLNSDTQEVYVVPDILHGGSQSEAATAVASEGVYVLPDMPAPTQPEPQRPPKPPKPQPTPRGQAQQPQPARPPPVPTRHASSEASRVPPHAPRDAADAAAEDADHVYDIIEGLASSSEQQQQQHRQQQQQPPQAGASKVDLNSSKIKKF